MPELIKASYIFIVFLVVAGFAMAYTLKTVNDIWGWFIMSLGPGWIVPSILRLYWWRFNGGGFAFGTAIGITTAILQRIFFPELDERLQFASVFSITFVCTIIATYLSKPTEPEVLENFYKKTRPFGVWGPLKRILPADVRKKMEKEHRNDLLAVPFAMGWQITLFMMPMQLLIRTYNAFYVTFAVFVVCMTGMYFFWYKNLPPVPQENT